MIVDALLATALFVAAQQAADPFTPPRLLSGGVAQIPVMQLAGGEVFFEAALDTQGQVAALTPLRTTAGLTEPVSAAIRGWRFQPPFHTPAGPLRGTKVLVGAFFRAPTVVGPTLGSPPVTVGAADDELPFPLDVQTPSFPPTASAAGMVLLELRVEADGSVSRASVIASAPPFDGPAVDAAKKWRFRPARVDGSPAAAYVYVLIGFPLPITGGSAR